MRGLSPYLGRLTKTLPFVKDKSNPCVNPRYQLPSHQNFNLKIAEVTNKHLKTFDFIKPLVIGYLNVYFHQW